MAARSSGSTGAVRGKGPNADGFNTRGSDAAGFAAIAAPHIASVDEMKMHNTTVVDGVRCEQSHLLEVTLIVAVADLDGDLDRCLPMNR